MNPPFTENEIIEIAVAAANASTAYTRAPGTVLRHRASIEAMVAKAYELRPPSEQMQRTNHALAAELADVKARLESAERGERSADQEVDRLQRELEVVRAVNTILKSTGEPVPLPPPKPTPEEANRAEFETWAKGQLYNLKRDGVGYAVTSTNGAWGAWQAARKSKPAPEPESALQYRLLNAGETTKAGDELWSFTRKAWVPDVIGITIQPDWAPYRRRI